MSTIPSIPQRKIGETEVGCIGYGAMGIAAFYGKALPDEERFKVLDAALAAGATYWDSANIYGDSEELLGKWYVLSTTQATTADDQF